MVAPLRALHRDQKGTISILSVFAVLVLTMLLGMVMNVGRQFDGKIRMQNAADSAAYSGAAVIARGMNTLAFTNHLMCDVFAMTALMREAHERNAEQFVPSILSAWNKIAPVFGQSKFPKFLPLPTAISGKVPLEQQLVTAFGQWGNASSERILPIMETILSEELIPQYQRAAVQAFPQIAQLAAAETVRRNGIPDYGRGQMFAVLWRTNVTAVGGDGEQASPTLPVVDPTVETQYGDVARAQRNQIAKNYLDTWNGWALWFFDYAQLPPPPGVGEAKMCQFGALWRGFTCGQLMKLFDENQNANLPFCIRTPVQVPAAPSETNNAMLAQEFTFIGVAYWQRLSAAIAPKVFRNPMPSDSLAFAEVRVFVPTPRPVWQEWGAGGSPFVPPMFPPIFNSPPSPPGQLSWHIGTENVPVSWDLFTQNWTAQLVPATQPCLVQILQQEPPGAPQNFRFNPPDHLGALTIQDILTVSPH